MYINYKEEGVRMKKLLITMLIVGAISGLMCCSYSKNVDKNKLNRTNTKVEATSMLIRYDNKNYMVVPSDLIEQESKYFKKLDNLGLEYWVKNEYIGDCVKDLEEGAKLYNTIRGDDSVLIFRDYNNEFSYVFSI